MRTLRPARPTDVDTLQALIQRSGIGLSAPYYTPIQAEAITRHVFGVDSQLVEDGTYFLIEADGDVVACGGWSKRNTLFGGDQTKSGSDPLLDPTRDAARIRAFFVDPSHARKGLGRQLMDHCVLEAKANGFSALELASTLPGEPLYLACDFTVIERFELELPGGIHVPLTRMRRAI